VVCDPDTRTELPGLYVAGEDAGGAHGANRLGGNGVANSTVFGGVAGEEMAAHVVKQGSLIDPDEALVEAEIARAMLPFSLPAGRIHPLRERLQDVMWDDVGVMRDAGGLAKGLAAVRDLKAELLATGLPDGDKSFNLTWHDWLNTRSLIEISETIAQAALSRENSRGAHYREDFLEPGDMNASYFTVTRQADEVLSVTREQVRFTIVKPGESLLDETIPAMSQAAA
jgi:fumarate reductase flavoprotein subunit